MTKITKNEKLLREATSKWSKFLKEGAFAKREENLSEGGTMPEYERYTDPNFPNIEDYPGYEKGDIEFAASFNNKYKDKDGNPYPNLLHKGKPVLINQNGERYIKDDEGRILWLTTTDDWIKEDNLSEGGTMGEYGKIDAEDGNPPSKIGRGNEEYMAAYNAVLQARGEEPLDIQKPDQAYLDALRSGQLEEAAEADPRVVAMQQAMDLLDDLQFDSLESALDNMNTEVVRKLSIMLKQLDYNRNQVGNIEENEKKKFKVGEFVYVVGGSLKGASGKILEPVTTTTGEEGFAIELYSDADKKLFGQRGDEVIAVAGDLESGGTTDGMELYDIDEKKNLEEALPPHLAKFFDDKGNLTPDAAERIKKYRKENPKAKVKDVTPKGYGPKSEKLSPEDRAHYDSVMNKGKVPNLKGDMGPLPGLEGPFQFRSGAVLYYDPKAGAYYDRGKDMYLDREEAARLTMEGNPSSFSYRPTHSSDPEMDQVMDIAADMLELGARSRIPVSLVGVESALQNQGFDTKMEKGKLIVDDKYVIAAKESLPDTAQKISFTKYAADYLSNIEGEQLDLPME